MPAAARSKLCSRVSAWLGVFASIAMSSASVICFNYSYLTNNLTQLYSYSEVVPSIAI